MAYDVVHKNSTVAGTPPTASEIELGEIGINAADAELYVKDTNGNIRKFQNTTTGTADGVRFTQAGTGAVARTVESKLKDFVSVKDFGAVGDGVTDDTAAIQAAIDFAVANTTNLQFPDGTYSVSQITINTYATAGQLLIFDFSGSTIVGTSSATTPVIIKGYSLNVINLFVNAAAGTTYAVEFGALWWSRVSGLRAQYGYNNYAPVRIRPTGDVGAGSAPYSFSWNNFYDWSVGKITFDVTNDYITANQFFGGRCWGVEVLNGVDTFYGNNFSGYDINGAISNVYTLKTSEIVFHDCTYETNADVTGAVIFRGGAYKSNALAPQFADPSVIFDVPTPANINNGVYAWNPSVSGNLFTGGDGSTNVIVRGDVSLTGIGSNYLNLFCPDTAYDLFDTTVGDTITLPRTVYRCNAPSGAPRMWITLPQEYLPLAKKIGWVSFSWWVRANAAGEGFGSIYRDVSGSSTGSPIAGGNWSYSAGVGNWQLVNCTIPVPDTATTARVSLSTSNSAHDFWYDGISVHVGRVAIPFSKGGSDVNGFGFTKVNFAGVTSANLFSFDPAANTAGQIKLAISQRKSAWTPGSTVGNSMIVALVNYYNQGGTVATSVTPVSNLNSGTNGNVTAIDAAAAGSTITVSASIVAGSSTSHSELFCDAEFVNGPRQPVILL